MITPRIVSTSACTRARGIQLEEVVPTVDDSRANRDRASLVWLGRPRDHQPLSFSPAGTKTRNGIARPLSILATA